MPHGRGQVQYVELGLRRDGTIVGLRCRVVGDAGAYAGFGGMLAFGPTRIDGAGRLPHPQDRVRRRRRSSPTSRRWARTAVPAARKLPRCSSASWTWPPAELGIDPVVHPPAEPPRPRGVPLHDGDRRDLRHRRLRRRAHRGGPAGRATTSCGPSRPTRRERGDTVAARHRGLRLRRDHRGRRGQRVLRGRDPRRRHRHGEGGHVGPRPGPRHRVLAARVRAARHTASSRSSSCSPTPHGCCVAAAPAGRARCSSAAARCSARPAKCSNRPGAWPASCSRPRPKTSCVTADGRLGVAGVPAKSFTWAEVATAAEEQRRAARRRARLPPGRRDVPVRRARRRGRGRHRDRQGRCRSATSRSTTAGGSSTRCSSTVRCTAASRRASRRRCGSTWSTTKTATRSRRRSPSTRSRARRSFATFEVGHTETPSPMNPLGAKGIGESATVGSTPAVQNAVVDACQPPRRPPHRHAAARPERVWRAIEDARAGTLPDPVARAAGRVRRSPGPPPRGAASARRRHRHLTRHVTAPGERTHLSVLSRTWRGSPRDRFAGRAHRHASSACGSA